MKYSILCSLLCLGCCGSFQKIHADPLVELNYTFTTINVPGSTSTALYGINESGQIVGAYTDSTGAQHGFLDTNGAFTTLPFVPTGINNVGQIVGLSDRLILDTNGIITNIAIPSSYGLPYYIGDRLAKINDLGQIAGNFTFRLGTQGFIYTNGTFTLLPVADPNADEENISVHGINNAGQVLATILGFAGTINYLYQNGHYITRVLACLECTFLSGAALNNVGQAVGTNGPGTYVDTNGVIGAFPFLIGGPAFDINDAGVIVGGDVIATPVPEPASWVLFGIALLGLGAWLRCHAATKSQECVGSDQL